MSTPQAPLEEIAKDSLTRFIDYRDLLVHLFTRMKEASHRYTYRQFSQDLGFDSHHVSYILTLGLRKMTPRYANTICGHLQIKGWQRKYLLTMLEHTDAESEQAKQEALNALIDIREAHLAGAEDRQTLRFFRNWYHAAIFEMVSLPYFNADPEHISRCFFKRVSPEEVRGSLQLLEEMKLLERDGQSYRKTKKTLSLGRQVSGMAVVGYHYQMMDLAKASMSNTPAEQREIGSLTLSLSEGMAERLKQDLQLFRKYAVFLSEQCSDPSQVVQLNLQLFPVTRPTNSLEEKSHEKPHTDAH